MIIESMDNIEVDVNYGDKIITYDKHTINQLELASAITIHKNQEIENEVYNYWSCSKIMMRSSLNRNLLYTAITRAEERCIIIQQEDVFNQCICKKPKEKK